MCKKPFALKTKDYNALKAKKILKDNNIKYLPILSDDSKFLNIITHNDFFLKTKNKLLKKFQLL